MFDIQTSNSVVAENLKHHITDRGLKQSAIAQKSGFTNQEFSDMLNGRRLMRAIDISNIINALDGVDANILFGIKKEVV
ncbi:helix-turn-helix domain-containing protein [Sporofaciens musculi]|uniref:helix-turn-helix domain-containing protein n=1 Tax=Sporofaciens musculi TaxID=2681861 RepID=UPI0025A11974|nr:helix-turn-helix transcriptional regulator [Sporofaciens musculi]